MIESLLLNSRPTSEKELDYQQTLSQKLQIQRELKQRIRTNPLEFYWPHAYGCDGKSCNTYISHHGPLWDGSTYDTTGCPQYAFHTSLAGTRAYFGGNRAGKTTAVIVEIAFHTTGYYPDWYPKEKCYRRATRFRIFAEDFAKSVGEVITPKIDEWFPQGSIKDRQKNNQGVYVKYWIKHTSGKYSVFEVLSYEQDPGVAEGWAGDGVAYDEPPPREHRVATARGLVDFEGREMFALTPLKEPWLFDEVYESKSPDVKSFVADIRHNLHRINPLTGMGIGVTEKGIEILEKTLTEEEKEVRRHGRFRYLSGRIWKIWDRGVHTYSRKIWTQDRGSVIDGEPPRDWTRVFLIDPHDRRDHALLWIAKEKDYGRLFVYREALLKGYTFEETVDYIKEQETSARERILYRYIDPNFGPKNQANTNLTVRDTFEEAAGKQNYPMRFSFGDDHKKLGRQSVSSLLRYDINQPVSIINRPELIIADDCVNCIYQIEHYIWDDFKYGDRDAKEEEKPLNTCFPALLRYLALANINNTPPEILESSGALYT